MARHRNRLPQLDDRLFLTDGGLETTLIFHDGIDLPEFASFVLLAQEEGRARLRGYLERYIAIAREAGVGFILEAVTWRANRDWAARLGYGPAELAEANRRAIAELEALRAAHETEALPMVISGCVGPRGDGYEPGDRMSSDGAAEYHGEQIGVFAQTEADMVSAMTLSYVEEAVGIALAARAAGLPSAISFTVETDGRLPTGQPLAEAIEQVDAETDAAPAYYMINCAHPDHFAPALDAGGAWLDRISGLRANSSRASHAELDEASELDDGDPSEFGAQHASLMRRFPGLRVLGGCCGTDHRHVGALATALAADR